MVYCHKMTEIIDKICAKGALHRVYLMGNQDYFFEVSVRDKGVVGMGSSTVTMECQLWPETNTCVCFCNKPKLLHLPCSYVYAARGEVGIAGTYVSPYYLKEAVIATWSGELRGWRALADFTKPPPNGADWIPDPETKIIHRGRWKSRGHRGHRDS